LGEVDGRRPAGFCPVIVGPTAVGKTGLITKLARQIPVEVISLDSRQVYQGLKIGTAQPTAEELSVCPHHLVDFLSPLEKYDAMSFRLAFECVFGEITDRGGVPILVGGAGMYLTALRQGFMDLPGHHQEALPDVRARLESLSDEEIRLQLQKVDPISFEEIHPNDRYRSQRALEIHQIAGRPLSQLKAEQEDDPSLGLSFPTFVLQRDVPELDSRIKVRTQVMLENGWIEETESLMADFPADCPGLMTIGYREIVSFFQGHLARENLVPAIYQVTRQYAKRQRTWFRHIPDEGRHHPDDETLVQAIRKMLV
jgi:tRNA dimethylallyltransferase